MRNLKVFRHGIRLNPSPFLSRVGRPRIRSLGLPRRRHGQIARMSSLNSLESSSSQVSACFAPVNSPSIQTEEQPSMSVASTEEPCLEEPLLCSVPPCEVVDPLLELVNNGLDVVEAKDLFEGTFAKALEESWEEEALDAAVEACQPLLKHFESLKDAQDQNSVTIVYGVLQEFVLNKLKDTASSPEPGSMIPREIACILCFYHNDYVPTASKILSDSARMICQDVASFLEELKSEYLQRAVHDPLRTMITNRLAVQEPARVSLSGRMMTTLPEDLAFMAGAQLNVAKESLPLTMQPDVVAACNHEFFNMIGTIMLSIESGWKDMSAETLSATVNDARCFLDFCEKQNNVQSRFWDEQQSEEGEDLLRAITELSLLANKYLCEIVLNDVRAQFLSKIGTPEWREGQVVETVLATLRDYFRDLIHWVPTEYYFPKILRHCFDMTLQEYVGAFFSNTLSHGLVNPEQCRDALQRDWLLLWDFFGKADHDSTCLDDGDDYGFEDPEDFTGKAGHYSRQKIFQRLHILQAISSLLGSVSADGSSKWKPSDLRQDIETMMRDLGCDNGAIATLHLAGLCRARMCRTTAQEWHETIASAMEHTKMQELAHPVYKLVDLRNSPYIRRVRPDLLSLTRNGSNDSIGSSESTGSSTGSSLDISRTRRMVAGKSMSQHFQHSMRSIRGGLLTEWNNSQSDDSDSTRVLGSPSVIDPTLSVGKPDGAEQNGPRRQLFRTAGFFYKKAMSSRFDKS